MAYSLCGASTSNLGEQGCDKSRGVYNRPLIFNGTIAESDYASQDAFFNKLVANAKLSKTAANKVFPLSEIQDIVNNSEANTEGTLGLGLKVILREGKPVYTIKYKAGSDLLKRIRTFNNQTIRIIEYDANGTFWMTKSGTNAIGFQANIFTTGNQMANGSELTEGIVTTTISVLSTSEYIDNAYWMESTGNINDIAPLLDVNIKYVSNATNVWQYKFEIPGSNIIGAYNIYDESGAALAALASDFSATGNGASLAITSMAVNASLKTIAVTYDSIAFTALSTGVPVILIPPTITELNAGDVTGVEILTPAATNKPA